MARITVASARKAARAVKALNAVQRARAKVQAARKHLIEAHDNGEIMLRYSDYVKRIDRLIRMVRKYEAVKDENRYW